LSIARFVYDFTYAKYPTGGYRYEDGLENLDEDDDDGMSVMRKDGVESEFGGCGRLVCDSISTFVNV
jgi:hypothetical protein